MTDKTTRVLRSLAKEDSGEFIVEEVIGEASTAQLTNPSAIASTEANGTDLNWVERAPRTDIQNIKGESIGRI